MSILPFEIFKTVIESTPLISIDLVVRNELGQILLGKRVLKDESFDIVFKRLIKVELGLTELSSSFKGVYQHFYDDNFSEEQFTTHYVVLAYEIKFNGELSSLLVEQHSDYECFFESELLNHEKVHVHSKWYFQKNKQADLLFK